MQYIGTVACYHFSIFRSITDICFQAMAGTRFVYGDGWEDIKDCFSGTLGLGRGHPDNTAGGSSSRSSRQRVYGGDHYVHPHHLGSRRSEGGCCGLDVGECLGDLAGAESCNKTRLGLSVLFLWVILLTIVCIVLGSNIGKKHFFIFRTIQQNL